MMDIAVWNFRPAVELAGLQRHYVRLGTDGVEAIRLDGSTLHVRVSGADYAVTSYGVGAACVVKELPVAAPMPEAAREVADLLKGGPKKGRR